MLGGFSGGGGGGGDGGGGGGGLFVCLKQLTITYTE